jgi:uncharacterized protein (TIGR03066 family)
MSAIRMLAVGTFVCLLAIGARADEKKTDYAKTIVGKWEVTKTEGGGPPEGTVIEFTKDGKLSVKGKMGDQEINATGTYKVDGDKFEFTLKIGDDEHKDTITIKKLEGDTMSTSNKDGHTVEMKRKK